MKRIADNAGIEGAVVVDTVSKHEGSYGYDAQNDRYGDLFEWGIIDPTKVTRTALQNAASIAGLMITTEALVAEKPEEKKQAPAHAGMNDMY
jgi:chaperonin GroEL